MQLSIDTPVGTALAELERPKGRVRGLLALGHGAGGGIEAADLRAARSAALATGVAVARLVQPYRVAGRRSPAPAATLDRAWIAAVAAVQQQRGLRSVPLITGGRSSGARVACRTATQVDAVGVVALAFPVHPPGRPEKTRLPELDGAGVPVLVVQGDRDAFGMPPAAPGRTIAVIAGADHSMKRDAAGIGAAVAAFLESLLG
ncbi:MAG TPA: alpha/beta family hydrolase [Jatrophihabitantaceae bacterium]|nr:alpha/beta family hydrolase [Jatrophihabitantaceae bacterium]